MVSRKDEKIITEALKRFDKASEADRENRERALEDIRFVHEDDSQWTEADKRKRQGRPCMQFDRTSGAVDQIVGDMLQDLPGIKIRPGEDGDVEVAEIQTGMIRAISNASEAKRAKSTAFKFSVTGGFGVWRIRHDWVDGDSFYQDILWEPVDNPFTVLFDPGAKNVLKDDGEYCFVFEDIDNDSFEQMWPKAATSASFPKLPGVEVWHSKDSTRVAEYFRRVPKTTQLCLLSDGKVVDKEKFAPIQDEAEANGLTVVRERTVDGHEIEYYKITASEILEKVVYKGKYFPLVPVYGKQINIAGEHRYRGVVRKAKDPQRLFNYELNSHAEVVALQSRAPMMATAKMIEGQESQWQNLNVSNDPVLIYNADPMVGGGRPTREAPPQASSGHMTMINLAADNIKSATGIYDSSLGATSNETSGRAILARDRQGDTATYEFTDELVEATKLTGKIIIDLIPHIYDTQRQIRILGEDEAEDVVTINQPMVDLETGEQVLINDLSRGKYDVAVQVGPSYSTKRVETAEQLSQIIAQNPSIAPLVLDLWIKSLDLVGGDEAVKRVRKMLVAQGVAEPTEEEIQEQQEMQQAAQQQQPDPLEALDAREKEAEIAVKEADAQKKQAEIMEIQTQAQLNQAKAQETTMRFDPRTQSLVRV